MSRDTERRPRRLTYANVVATLALFGAVAGGTAVALPGKQTVQANDLKKNAVKATAIAKNAVGSAEIKTGAVKGADVADGSLRYEDLGSNSVIARIRSTGPTNTEGGTQTNPVPVPLSANSWTQGANETNVLFGQITFTSPAACGMGALRIQYFLDGERVNYDEGFSPSATPTVTENLAFQRPFVFEPGTDTPRVLELKIYDDCGAGNDFTVENVALNVVAIR